MTLKQLRDRYPSLSIVADSDAPTGRARAELKRKLSTIDKAIGVGGSTEQLKALVKERTAVWLELQRYRVRFYSGRTSKVAGVVVGQGDTQAAALTNAAQRLGRA